MKDGWIRVGASSPILSIGDCKENARRLVNEAKEASACGVKVLTFPELSLCGFTVGDLLFSAALQSDAEEALAFYCAETANLPLFSVLGAPIAVDGNLFDCAVCVSGGRILGVLPRRRLSASLSRHFTPFTGSAEISLCGCAHIPFSPDLRFSCREMPLLTVAPLVGTLQKDASCGASLVLSLFADSERAAQRERRRLLANLLSLSPACAAVCAGAGEGESTGDGVFGGHCLIAENGEILAERTPFSPASLVYCEVDLSALAAYRREDGDAPAPVLPAVPFSLPLEETPLSHAPDKHPFYPEDEGACRARCDYYLTIQAKALLSRMQRARAKTLVLGFSGGLDSTIALLVCRKALALGGIPLSSLTVLTMPGFGTSKRTKGNTERLCDALGISLREVNITQSVRQHFADIGHDESVHNAAYENAQARERTQILMDIANDEGGLVIGTGDLSELALGWATYNGDHMSMYAVNASLPKTLIRKMTEHEARRLESEGNLSAAAALDDILATPVSPELLPSDEGEIAQKTEGIVGPYELHDFFLYYFARFGFGPEKLLRMATLAFADAYPAEEIERVLSLFFTRYFSQQFKRSCLPDGPIVSEISLSPRGGLVLPSDLSSSPFLRRLKKEGRV